MIRLAKRNSLTRIMEDSTQNPQTDLHNAVHDEPMPPSIKVFGILQIVFGSMGCVCGGFGAGFMLLALNNSEFSSAFKQGLTMSYTEGYPTLLAFTACVNLVLSVFQITCGVGLLKKCNWGRIGSILYAVVTMLVSITSAALTISMMKDGPGMTINLIGSIGGTVFYLIYPICILFFLTRPKVVEALRNR